MKNTLSEIGSTSPKLPQWLRVGNYVFNTNNISVIHVLKDTVEVHIGTNTPVVLQGDDAIELAIYLSIKADSGNVVRITDVGDK
jgi:hypothetical protein